MKLLGVFSVTFSDISIKLVDKILISYVSKKIVFKRT